MVKYTPCPTHGSSNKNYVAGCLGCRAREHERDVARGRIKRPGHRKRLDAMTPEERLAYKRQRQNEKSAAYRIRHGRPHDRRYGVKLAELKLYWQAAGIPLVCVYCGGAFEHVDHFVPRSRGGADTFSNMLPACAHCNISKNNRDPVEWIVGLLMM